jgi:hypothetical protein
VEEEEEELEPPVKKRKMRLFDTQQDAENEEFTMLSKKEQTLLTKLHKMRSVSSSILNYKFESLNGLFFCML